MEYSDAKHIQHVAVIGAGFMGTGIAQVAAQAGLKVTLVDVSEGALAQAQNVMRDSLVRLSEKGHIQEDIGVVLDRLSCATSLEDVVDIPFIFESIFERLEAKHAMLQELEALCSDNTTIATNTSTIPIGELAKALTHKNRLIGVHFFSPVPMNPLLEIIPSVHTDKHTLQTATDMGKLLGKHPLQVKADIPGFLMNRMYAALAHEAIGIVERGAGTVVDVDRGMQLGYGMAIGPLTIADLVGLDVCLHVMENLGRFDPDWKLAPSPLLQRMVAEGKLGRKSGSGFYRYDAKGKVLGLADEFVNHE